MSGMFPFVFVKAPTEQAALAAGRDGGRYIAGGTTLVDLMRETVERPGTVVDITALPYRDIELRGGVLRLGALATMADVAASGAVRREFPVLAQALERSASAQLRNMATIGGNLMQRPRCLYFRDVTAACNRRNPGSGCSAIEGHNRTHAVLGTSSACVATHPSDMAVALVALDASVTLRSTQGDRQVPAQKFFLAPGSTPEQEHDLRPGELIVGVEVLRTAVARTSGYLKVRDRQSYEFALASAAIGLEIRAGVIRSARIAVGGVATVPWRLPAVEAALIGRPPRPELFNEAAALAADGARSLSENSFKIALVQRTVARQLAIVAEGAA